MEPIPPIDLGITLRPGEQFEFNPESTADLHSQSLTLRNIRGNVLASSITIEFALDILIRELLFPSSLVNDKTNQKQLDDFRLMFDSCISKSSVIAFSGKIRVLRNLLDARQVIAEGDCTSLINKLESVNKVRNRFAHFSMAFDPGSGSPKPRLRPYMVVSGKRVYLDNSYFDELNKLFTECHIRVENVTRVLNNTPIQPLPDEIQVLGTPPS